MKGGKFIAGTESRPHAHQLTFVLFGNLYDPQMPMFGNKGIMCLECSFSMYGVPRFPTWTYLASTVNPGDTTFTLSQDVDWQVGETVAIASTSFFHTESERMTIQAISGRTVTTTSPFAYQHVSVVETHGSDSLKMKA